MTSSMFWIQLAIREKVEPEKNKRVIWGLSAQNLGEEERQKKSYRTEYFRKISKEDLKA